MCISMTVNISLTGDTEIIVGASRNVIFARGQVTGLSSNKLLGVSWAYYSDYTSGYPRWKENYTDGKGDYVYVYPNNPNFSRDMADSVTNYNYDYVLVIIARDPNDLSIITAERYFRLYSGAGGLLYYPLTDTIIYGDEPPVPPPPSDYPKNITRDEYTFIANNNTEEIYFKGFLGISPATVPIDTMLVTKNLQGLTEWKEYWNSKWNEIDRPDMTTFTNNKFLEFKNKLDNGDDEDDDDEYKKYIIPAVATIIGACIIVSGRKK